MIRATAALLLLAPLSACLAGAVAGTAVGAAASAGGGTAQPRAQPIFHGFGSDPGWAIDIFEQSIVFFTAGSAITVPAPPSFTTADGHRWETERIVVEVTHQACRANDVGAAYPQSVRVIADGTEYAGCGAEARAD